MTFHSMQERGKCDEEDDRNYIMAANYSYLLDWQIIDLDRSPCRRNSTAYSWSNANTGSVYEKFVCNRNNRSFDYNNDCHTLWASNLNGYTGEFERWLSEINYTLWVPIYNSCDCIIGKLVRVALL